jgi:RNA-binding protein YhbY
MALIAEMVDKTKATLVQTIGHTALLYRKAQQPKLQVPKK